MSCYGRKTADGQGVLWICKGLMTFTPHDLYIAEWEKLFGHSIIKKEPSDTD